MSGNFLMDSESRLELLPPEWSERWPRILCVWGCLNKQSRESRKKSTYQGKTYYFTSDECKKRFDKNPAQYARK